MENIYYRRFNPGWEQASFIRLEEEELIEILDKKLSVNRLWKQKRKITNSICNLLDWFDVVTGDELVIGIEKLNASLLECSLSQQKTLDAGET